MSCSMRGCLILAAVTVACCSATALATRELLPRSLGTRRPSEPISVDGECPPDAVLAYYRTHKQRFEDVAHELDVVDSGAEYESLSDALATYREVDLVALREMRQTMAAEAVPECVRGIRDEDVAMIDLLIDIAATAGGEGRAGMRAGLVFARAVTGVAPILERRREATGKLEDRLGIELSDLESWTGEIGAPVSPE